MMMSIALRFIPTLIEETDKLMNAQKARGAMLDNGSMMERVKALEMCIRDRSTTKRPAPPCCWSPTAWRILPNTPTVCW